MSGLESLRLAAGYGDARNYAPAQPGLVQVRQILLIRFNPLRQANAMTSQDALRALPLKIHPIAPWQIPFYFRIATSPRRILPTG
ncbi:hypothetical protein FZ025_20545 [Xanthomonas hyacinthi]|uniref:hypothetical protein n=1 Tax=Xanthomonas hyacinthi TaxID=56455 RepID=UPI0011AFF6EC|nr:hypothetical protein [Xanthomonas hyacinthi]QGY78890.1 hypothetical protein FZ025_20545 [Xanthomonas hyacinthi]